MAAKLRREYWGQGKGIGMPRVVARLREVAAQQRRPEVAEIFAKLADDIEAGRWTATGFRGKRRQRRQALNSKDNLP